MSYGRFEYPSHGLLQTIAALSYRTRLNQAISKASSVLFNCRIYLTREF